MVIDKDQPYIEYCLYRNIRSNGDLNGDLMVI